MKTTVLIVDDEAVQREMLGKYLEKRGYAVSLAASGIEALGIIAAAAVDIVITDHKMPGMTGLELGEKLAEDHPNISTVILTAFGRIDDAVRAMKSGVEDYLTKPVNLEELELILSRLVDRRYLIEENERLRREIAAVPRLATVVYASAEMQEVMSRVARAAESNATVLVTGESGTGKEVVARAVHELSARRTKPFIAVNCSAIPENLIESEFFGHEKGAFTGAESRRMGRFEQADGGTLFLDEIAEVPSAVQVKLLRVLQERSFERVGGNDPVSVDVRIVAATNQDVERLIAEGGFREDLYYRLNVVGIVLPPLRKRKADIPVLIEHFIARYAGIHGKKIAGITPDALDALVKYPFPGNVRELGNVIEQAVVLTRGDVLNLRDMPARISATETSEEQDSDGANLDDRVADFERAELRRAMVESDGNKSAAARLLGISERKIRYMLQKYGEA